MMLSTLSVQNHPDRELETCTMGWKTKGIHCSDILVPGLDPNPPKNRGATQTQLLCLPHCLCIRTMWKHKKQCWGCVLLLPFVCALTLCATVAQHDWTHCVILHSNAPISRRRLHIMHVWYVLMELHMLECINTEIYFLVGSSPGTKMTQLIFACVSGDGRHANRLTFNTFFCCST